MHLSHFGNHDLYEMYFIFVCLLQLQHFIHCQRNKSGLFFSSTCEIFYRTFGLE